MCLTQQVQRWPLQSVDSGQYRHSLRSVTILHHEFICAVVLSCPGLTPCLHEDQNAYFKFSRLQWLSYLGRHSHLEFPGLFFLISWKVGACEGRGGGVGCFHS